MPSPDKFGLLVAHTPTPHRPTLIIVARACRYGEGFDYNTGNPDYWLLEIAAVQTGLGSDMLRYPTMVHDHGNVWIAVCLVSGMPVATESRVRTFTQLAVST